MSLKRDAPADTWVEEDGSRGDVSGGPDSNGEDSDSGYHVDPQWRGVLTGRLLDGRYQILELIGEGGMGAVYRAIHKHMDKELAVKVLLPKNKAMEGVTKRFQQEAQSASRLDHPGITQVFDFGQTDDGVFYLVMAYLRGYPLTDLIRDEAPLPADTAVGFGAQICDALAHAHTQGVVHRDLKPDNVMIVPQADGTEQVKLLDFGIAKITQGKGAATGITELGAVFGTPEYLSPEQAAGDPVDHRSDLYSVAVLLYEMLSGRDLFSVETKVQYLAAHIHHAPTPLTALVPQLGVSSHLDQVVLRGLSKQRSERFQSAEDMAQALRRAVSQPATPDSDVLQLDSSESLSPAPAVSSDKTVSPEQPIARSQSDLEAEFEVEQKRKLVVWGLASAVGALVVLVMALSLVLSDGSESGAGKGADVPRARAKDSSLQIVVGLIADSQLKQAEERLNELVQKVPKDPRVHLLYGHLYCRRRVADACLASYTTALVLDREVRLDKQLLANLLKLLTQLKGPRWGRPARVRAVGFATRVFTRGSMGEPVVKMLTGYVNKWWEHDLVWRILALLEQHKAAGGVDWSHAYEIRFRGVSSCDQRKKYIQEIIVRKDDKLLPLLAKLYTVKTLKKPYSRRRISNHCLQKEAAVAIRTLGGEVPKKKRSRSRGSKKHRRGR